VTHRQIKIAGMNARIIITANTYKIRLASKLTGSHTLAPSER